MFDALPWLSSTVHQHYIGADADKEPFLLSVVVTDANNHNVPQYRGILWKKTVSSIPSVTVVHPLDNLPSL